MYQPNRRSQELFKKVQKKQPLTRVERLELHGYKCVHLFKDWYLVRNYSCYSTRFSFYGLKRLDEANT